jgi:hypothetical protein
MGSSLKGSEIPLEYHMLWSKVRPDPDRNDSFLKFLERLLHCFRLLNLPIFALGSEQGRSRRNCRCLDATSFVGFRCEVVSRNFSYPLLIIIHG